MQIPENYRGDLRYRREDRTSTEAIFEDLVLDDLRERVEAGEVVSWTVVFDDYGERSTRELPFVNQDTLDRALDWYHEVQEGKLVRSELGDPKALPPEALDEDDW